MYYPREIENKAYVIFFFFGGGGGKQGALWSQWKERIDQDSHYRLYVIY